MTILCYKKIYTSSNNKIIEYYIPSIDICINKIQDIYGNVQWNAFRYNNVTLTNSQPSELPKELVNTFYELYSVQEKLRNYTDLL